VTTQRLRVLAPPGARELRVPLAPGCTATVARVAGESDGRDAPAAAPSGTPAAGAADTSGAASAAAPSDRPNAAGATDTLTAASRGSGELVVALPAGNGRPATYEITVEPAPGLSGGALLAGPVAFAVGPGRMPLGDWQELGLASHSGGVRYRRRVTAAEGSALRLDLGEVRGTAEVFVDGESVGVRVCSPYTFDLSGRIGPDGATVEILVLNTLGPHLDAVSPTPYVFAGQRRSGLFGPVRLLAGQEAESVSASTRRWVGRAVS
jgi:hypothetical protein